MPWVRIDENAIEHPKFRALSDGAFRLWVEGLAYCQKNLTDGFVPNEALKQFHYYSPKRRAMLTAILIPGKGPMWHEHEAGGIWVHDYLVWNDCRDHVLKKRAGGQERLARFREKQRGSQRVALVRGETLLHTTPHHSLSENQTDTRAALFEQFWAAYPRRVGRDAAWKAWQKRRPDKDLLVVMLAKLEEQKRSEQWRKDDGRFIPHPATWLNQGRWQDEVPGSLALAEGVPERSGVPDVEASEAYLARLRASGKAVV